MSNNVIILKSNFLIAAENVKPAFNAIIRAYPNIKSSMKHQSSATLNLQYALHLLGYHTRIHQNGMLFGLSKTTQPYEFIPEPDYRELFELLGIFTQPGSNLEVVIDGIGKHIVLNSADDPIDAKTILNYLTAQEGVVFTKKEVKEMSEDVIQKIASDIVPDVIKTESKSMGELVSEAIAVVESNNDEKIVDEVLQVAIDKIEKPKPVKKPRVPKEPRAPRPPRTSRSKTEKK